jgi:hypothetical protein
MHINEDTTQTFFQMIDDRNLATHTYHESLANEIFVSIHTYINIFQALHTELSKH